MNGGRSVGSVGPAETGRCEVSEGIWVDARRAVYLERHGLLAVADLHLGFAWAQRRRGQLLPVGAPDDTVARLRELCGEWRPRGVVVLGDVVHEAAPVEGIREALTAVLGCAGSDVEWHLVLGNHDRRLAERLREWGMTVPCHARWEAGDVTFIHGDVPMGESWKLQGGSLKGGGVMPGMCWVLSGHEHPAVELGDGGTTVAKVPAFLVGDAPGGVRSLVLPAFSGWAAGSVVGRRPFLGEWARQVRWERAVACLGRRVLGIPWGRLGGG